MNFKTKVRYLKIIHTHKQIDTSLKENAPYISKSRIFELTARSYQRAYELKPSYILQGAEM